MWLIDKDHIADPNSEPGTLANAASVTSRDCDPTQCTRQFRMYDDDDVLYYEGRANEVSFDPLDDFGMPNAGCTSIQYLFPNGKWETI